MTTATTTTTMIAEKPKPIIHGDNPAIKVEPGRIQSLTTEERECLRDMWLQIALFAGTVPPALAKSVTISSATSASEPKRTGFFGRKAAAPASLSAKESADEKQNRLREALGSSIEPRKLRDTLFYMVRADHPDNLVLRFLRARKWNVTDALAMLGQTLKWRLEAHIEEIVRGQENVHFTKGKANGDLSTNGSSADPDYEPGTALAKNSTGSKTANIDMLDEDLINKQTQHQFKAKKAYVYGCDRMGRPIVHVRPQFHNPKDQSQETMERYTVLIIENTRLCLRDPVDTAAVIFDLSKFSLSNMDYGAVKFIIQCFEGHYPESLGFILIHKAPWIFQGIWNVIKHWIDPVVAAKISFTQKHKDVLKFIDDDYIPKDLGGKREYEYEYIEPLAGENDLMKDTDTISRLEKERHSLFDEFEEHLINWLKAETPAEIEKHQDLKNKTTEKLKENYWTLDPYIRARSVFDRVGVPQAFQPELR